MNRPDVSVVIAAYNAEDFVGAALHSALTQRGVAADVIVVDDCSTDGTAAAVQAFADERVRLMSTFQNSGPSCARNVGFDAAQAPFVAVLDADDTMGPERLERLLDLATATSADIVADNICLIEAGSMKVAGATATKSDEAWTSIDLATFFTENLLFRKCRSFGYLKPVFRKSFWAANKLHYDESLRVGEDYAVVAEALAAGAKYVLSPSAEYFYTVSRAGSISNRLTVEHAAAMLASASDFHRRHGSQMSEDERVAEYLRTMTIEDGLEFLKLIGFLKAGKFSEAARAVVRRPRILLLLRLSLVARAQRLRTRRARLKLC